MRASRGASLSVTPVALKHVLQPFFQQHLQRLMQPVEQTGAGAQGKKPFLFKASVSSQSKYDFGDCALLAAASALPLTAPKENPGGNINPFCEPATVTSTPHSS